MKFEQRKLGELIVNYDRMRIPLSSRERAEKQGQYPYYGATSIMDFVNDYLFDGTYILLGEDGTVIDENGKPILQIATGKFWCNNHAHVLQNSSLVEFDYLYYLLKNTNVRSIVTGAVQPKISQGNLNNLDVIIIADKKEQRRVAQFLKCLDDKIAINNEINNNLQHQARALFKEWFVDFTPFSGQMPADWKKGKLRDVLLLKRYSTKAGANAELPYLPIDTIPMNTFSVSGFRPNEEAQSSLILFNEDDIIIGAMRVYFHRVVIAPCAGITRTTCFTLSPFDPVYLSFGLLCCDQDSSIDYAQKTSKGSTMPYAVWEGGLGDMEIAIPSKEIASKFHEIVYPMLKIIKKSCFENQNLSSLRDSLLPRLMSGEVDLSDVEI